MGDASTKLKDMKRPRRLEDDSASYLLSVVPLIEDAGKLSEASEQSERERLDLALKNVVVEIQHQVRHAHAAHPLHIARQ
jgi:hypothetical protein